LEEEVLPDVPDVRARVKRAWHPERDEQPKQVVLHAARAHLAREPERALCAAHGCAPGAVRECEDGGHQQQPAHAVVAVGARREGGARGEGAAALAPNLRGGGG